MAKQDLCAVGSGTLSENGRDTMTRKKHDDDMRSHYDFSSGVRGKYAARYAEGTNVVVLAPDLAEVFPDSIAVNEDLRTLVRTAPKRVRVEAVTKKRIG
jgi:hypothetical protein